MKRLLYFTAIAFSFLLFSCGKGSTPTPTVNGNGTGTGTGSGTGTNTGTGSGTGSGTGTGTGTTNTPWAIVPIIRTYDGGSEYANYDNKGDLLFDELDFTDNIQHRLHLMPTGAGSMEWVNAKGAILTAAGKYTYEVTLPNAVTKDATLSDTASTTIPYLRIRIPDIANKKMNIYYAFISDPFSFSNDKGFNAPVDAAIFNSVSVTNNVELRSY